MVSREKRRKESKIYGTVTQGVVAAFERKRTVFYSDYELYIILSTCVSHSIGLRYI